MFNLISLLNIKKISILITFLLLMGGCKDTEHINDIIVQAKNIGIKSWDQNAQTEFKALLSDINSKGYSEEVFEKMALISLTHGELKVSTLLLNLLTKKSFIADYDYYLAEIAIQGERYDMAHKLIIRGLSKANKADKKLFYMLRVEMLMNIGEFEKVQDTIDRVLQIHSDDLEARYQQAKLLLLNGNCQGAINTLEGLINDLPQYKQLYSPLASAYRMCGKNKLAQKYSAHHTSEILQFPNRFNEKKESIGNPVSSLKNDIKASISQRDFKTAIKKLLQLIQIEPNEARNHINLGSMYYRLREITKAKAAYENAYKLDPKNIKSSVNLGIVNMALGDYKKAEMYFNKALEIYPFHLKATLNLASIKLSMNSPNEAESLLLGILDKNSLNFSVQKGLIVSLCMQKKYKSAQEKMSDWIKFEPDSQKLLALYAQLLLQKFDADLTLVNIIQDKLFVHMKQYPKLLEYYVLLEVKYKNLLKINDAIKISEDIMGEKLSSKHVQKLSQLFKQLKSVGYLDLEIFNE